MSAKPILVVMAAGMGSRYGGLKQIDPVGSCGEAILDYSLFDAHEAGFETAVIIIKKMIEKDFMETVGKRLEKCPLEIRYAYQEMDKIPAGYSVPEGRTKPLGTGHAILCAKDEIGDAPFVAINADDYYGKSAYRVIYNYLCNAQEGDHCMVGYMLGNTVTDNGSVARGACAVNADRKLTDIEELLKIEKYEGGIRFTRDDGATWQDIDANTVVSLNMWGFAPGFLEELAGQFPAFLEDQVPANPAKAEFLLPRCVDVMIKANRGSITVLESPDKWYGVTYAADKPKVVAALRELGNQGKYPYSLWG